MPAHWLNHLSVCHPPSHTVPCQLLLALTVFAVLHGHVTETVPTVPAAADHLEADALQAGLVV